MIEGIKIDVSSAELVGLMTERQSYHRAKSDRYAAQITALEESGIRPNPGQSGDPFRDLTNRRDEHARKAVLFGFMLIHVVPDETYRLSETDLGRLEVLDRWL